MKEGASVKTSLRKGFTGNESVAYAMKQIDPDVVAAYPITPQTELMHKFADYVANGKVKTELICVESEHSAMSACVGSSAAGARTMTATSANGFALMWEIVYIAASARLPIVMTVVNRALSGNINIHCDHSDSMGGRDAGWIQIFSENSQEAYDNAIQAIKIAEDKDVLLPVMITIDGFIISHTLQPVVTLEDDAVKKFVGEYKPDRYLLDTDNPYTFGPLDLQDYYFEHKRSQIEAMNRSPAIIEKVAGEFEKMSGRKYGIFEPYKLEDAEIAVVSLGSTAGTVKDVVDKLRDDGIKAGALKVRVFRPFPIKEIAEALSHLKAVAVLDRSVVFGGGSGPVFMEVRSAMYGKSVPIVNYMYGLGGRDITPSNIKSAFKDLEKISKTGKVEKEIGYLGLRE